MEETGQLCGVGGHVAPVVMTVVHVDPIRTKFTDQVLKTVMPRYPQEMRNRGVKGFVRLDVTVNEWGDVVDATVVESTYWMFSEEALRVIKDWEFMPTIDDLPAGHRHIVVPIQFVLSAR